MSSYTVDPLDVLILSVVVLYVGMFLNQRLRILRENFIPPSVTGGLICSVIVAIVYGWVGLEIEFDLVIRDKLLLVFFATIGLGAQLATLAAGGRSLVIVVVVAGVFLVLQNATGVGIAVLMGLPPGYGLMGGSVSFAGGHGTAIAWGAEAKAAGLLNAEAVGMAFATFGLVAGGVVGGPIAARLIKSYDLSPARDTEAEQSVEEADSLIDADVLFAALTAILVLAVCVGAGDTLNQLLFARGVMLPGFLTAMVVGIAITNLSGPLGFNIHMPLINRIGDVSLNIFLAMSMMSVQLWAIAEALAPILVVLMGQILLITFFTVLIVFRSTGRDYDACVMSAGFMGLGLGATPVAIANMDAITERFGPSAKAFLVIPLVGAFFIDLMNAAVIKFYIGMISGWFA